MKITKKRLMQIIKEEKLRLLKEQSETSALGFYIQNEGQVNESAAYEGPGAKGPMTQGYLMQALSNTITFGANKGKSRGDVVMDKIMQGRYHEAANTVMDALWIDDVSPEAEDELAQILSHQTRLDHVALAAADWGTKHFRVR